MKRCARYKELILTDYMDGELDSATQKEVAKHLETCVSCRALKEALLKKAVEPLKRAEKVKAPEYIWQNIRERIVSSEKPAEQGALTALRERLNKVFVMPRPALAFAAVTVLVIGLIVVRFSMYRAYERGYFTPGIESFSTGLEEGNGNADLTDESFGTSIEMFLT